MSSGGDDRPSTFNVRPAPPKAAVKNVVDEIFGTRFIKTQQNIDGKMQEVYLHTPLPRSKEKQRIFEAAQSVIAPSMEKIRELSNIDPGSMLGFNELITVMSDVGKERATDMAELTKMPDFSKFVESYKNSRTSRLQREYETAYNSLESDLAAKGRLNSTAGRSALASLQTQYGQAMEKLEVDAEMAGGQMYEDTFRRRSLPFEARERERQEKLRLAEANNLALRTQHQTALDLQNNLLSTGAQIEREDWQRQASSNAPGTSLNLTAQEDNYNLGAYGAETSAQLQNYQNQVNYYNNRPPSFGQQAFGLVGNIGSTAAGVFLGNHMSGGKSVAKATNNIVGKNN